MRGAYKIHKDVDAAFRCTGEHSCYPGADDMSGCTCLKEMQAAMPGKLEVIDSVSAVKAKQCCKELKKICVQAFIHNNKTVDVRELEACIRKYGQ